MHGATAAQRLILCAQVVRTYPGSRGDERAERGEVGVDALPPLALRLAVAPDRRRRPLPRRRRRRALPVRRHLSIHHSSSFVVAAVGGGV
jgi:hypothetical protein